MDYIFKSISDAKEMIERKPNQSTVDYKIYGVLTDCETTIKALHKAINGFTMNTIPVVLCKDCKKEALCRRHWDKDENWFCADGERNDGDGDG